jgi:hypothetical protein
MLTVKGGLVAADRGLLLGRSVRDSHSLAVTHVMCSSSTPQFSYVGRSETR